MEIDAYPANAQSWQQVHKTEASEEINALFGYLSVFHDTHGFYVDGVDEFTARGPEDWRTRAKERVFSCAKRSVIARFPALDDLAIAKMCRLEERDRSWIEALHRLRPLSKPLLRELLARVPALEPMIAERARSFLDQLH